jgi:surface antigen
MGTRNVWLRLLAGAVGLLVFFAPAPSAGAVTVTRATTKLAAGGKGTIAFNAGAGRRDCEVTARAGLGRLGPLRIRIHQPIVVLTGQVPRDARTLVWSASVRCSSSGAQVTRAHAASIRIHVKGHRKGAPRLFSRGSIRIHSYPADALVAPEPERTGGGKGGYVCASEWDGHLSVLDASSYCTGYCTWFVWQRRPEQQLKNLGNAWEWYGGAKARGIPVGSTPVVGAVAWWGISAHASEGHVAYVIGVRGSSVTVVEMNRTKWDVEDTRTLNSSELPNGYIYGGPAGNGSGSRGGAPPPPPPPPVSTPGGVLNNGLISVFTQGPEHTLDDYWVTPGQPWNGPLTVGAVGSTFSDPTAIVNATTGLISVFAEGSEHTLDDYWVTPGQPWNGPLTVGAAGSTFSQPAAVINQSTGLVSLFAEGYEHTLDDYWVTPGQPWNGPLTVGAAGSTFSQPAAVINQSTGLVSLFAEGSEHTLDDYWVTAGQPWSGPLTVGGAGGTFSSPGAVINQSTGLISLFAQGASNSLDDYWVTAGQPWSGPLTVGGTGGTFSSPAAVINQSTGLISLFAEGPENSLDDYWVTAGQPWNGPLAVGSASSTYATPIAVMDAETNLLSLFAQGAGNTLNDYWVYPGQPWNGPLAIAGEGSTF